MAWSSGISVEGLLTKIHYCRLMKNSGVFRWLVGSERRVRITLTMIMPLTAVQVARRTDLDRDSCSLALRQMARREVVQCLNTQARSSRVYFLRETGKRCQTRLRAERRMEKIVPPSLPPLNWDLYGWVCFRHRSAVVKAMREPSIPPAIRRCAREHNPHLRISTNNVRDTLRLMIARGLVRRSEPQENGRTSFDLTDTGRQVQELLCRAEALS